MVSNINDIYNLEQSTFQPKVSQRQFSTIYTDTKDSSESMNSFSQEDQAIISSEAKLQYELEKFNSGGDNAVELAVAGVMAKTTTQAEVNVINTKKSMLDTILDMGE